jgi:two-component system cell cycle sensor histidine kinase/response regulator CckA
LAANRLNAMGEPLRVLVVEDSADDAEMMMRELRRGGYDPLFERVETPEAFESALAKPGWDAVISDFSLPRFSAPAALEIAKRNGADLPFVILSGVVGETEAVSAMKAGAHDYIGKSNLARLVPAIRRELREAEIRRRSRQLEEALRQAQDMEMMGRFAGEIAREFDRALTAITRRSAALLSRLPEGETRPGVEEIKDIAEAARFLTQQLCAFTEKPAPRLKAAELNSIVEGIEARLRRLLGRNIYVRTKLDHELGPVKADQGQIEQMIVNLAVNAREAMRDGGTLTIETASIEVGSGYAHRFFQIPPGQYAMLAVADTGCGMDRQTQARAFEPFFTTKAKGAGMGLGLPIVYGIVKRHGGDIALESEPGCGTTVRIYLPRIADAVREAPGEAVKRCAGVATILIVDDDAGVRGSAREALEASGHGVLEACDGRAACLIGRRFEGRIDVLLSEFVLPDMSGEALAAELRRLHPESRVVYLLQGIQPGVASGGFAASVPKPFTPQSLLRAIERALGADRLSGE